MELLCDYLVVSAPREEHLARELRARYFGLLANPAVTTGRLWGYDTVSVDGGSTILGIRRGEQSQFDRSLLAVAGPGAEGELRWLLEQTGEGVEGTRIAVRRVDFQATVELQEDVNYLIDYLLVPAPGYGYLRLSSLSKGTEGAGLYVGSPRSDVRLRIYNKTADLERRGVLPEPGPGELLRVELVMRREAARRALQHLATSRERFGDLWLGHVCNRVPALADILIEGKPVPPLPRIVDGQVDRQTEAWIRRAVVPAVARYYAGNPEGLDEFFEQVLERWNAQPSRNRKERDNDEGC